jgi:hypothetical protein
MTRTRRAIEKSNSKKEVKAHNKKMMQTYLSKKKYEIKKATEVILLKIILDWGWLANPRKSKRMLVSLSIALTAVVNLLLLDLEPEQGWVSVVVGLQF